MNSELEELAMEYERTHAAACITEKRSNLYLPIRVYQTA